MKLIENPNIVKCLVNNEDNFLDVPLLGDFDVSSLIYNQIFPWRFVPKPLETANTFITMKFSYKPKGVTFKNSTIFFYIITHNSLLTTDYGTLRCDFLVNEIDKVFNSSRDLGLGKLEFYDMDEILVNENYSGISLAYKSTEFQ